MRKVLVLFCSLVIGTAAIAQTQPQTQSAPTVDKGAWLKANGVYDAGNILFGAKKYNEAAIKYREAISLWPQDWHYHYNLALALKHSGHGADAVAEFKKTLELNEKDWKTWKALGNTYWRLGQKTDAKAAFENALKNGAPAHEGAELRAGIAACER